MVNLQKNYFLNLESLCDDMLNEWHCCILLGLTNVFNDTFYFIQQIRLFCMISIFIINTKINFCILLFNEFCVFENEIKVCSKFYKKNYFTIWSLYVTICKMYDSVEFYSDYRIYLVLYFILYLNFVHFVWFRYFHKYKN